MSKIKLTSSFYDVTVNNTIQNISRVHEMKSYQQEWDNFLKYKQDKHDCKYRKKQVRQQRYYKKYNRRRFWLNKYKQSQGCYVCGYTDNAYALSFENNNKSTSTNYIKWAPKRLIEHIRTKKIICQNCTNIKFKEKCYSTFTSSGEH
mgnify:FL=1